MFLNIDKKDRISTAVIDDNGIEISYGDLCDFSNKFKSVIPNRTLIFILSENVLGSFLGYIATLSNEIVPLMLSCHIDRELLKSLMEIYKPAYMWIPQRIVFEFGLAEIYNCYDYSLIETGFDTFPLFEELSLLLSTSGSTGSPKLVRHSYKNIEANAQNVATFFEITKDDRALAILPMHYTMGLSVISSHLYAGATILLTNKSLMDMSLWPFIINKKATSFTGVPYSYEILYKLRFFKMNLPDLKIITQGGGKLSPELFQTCAEYAKSTGKKFIATYGQTEGTARMAYLPPEMATLKTGSIGKAIPNGELSIIDDDGNVVKGNDVTGQMVYKGSNVTLGYAICGEDLIKGDENEGVLYTGDIVRRDSDGFYYIIGRMRRFLKIFGLRVGLDEIEYWIKTKFAVNCLCKGRDELLNIIVVSDKKININEIKEYVIEKTGLFHKAIEISVVDEIERNEAGKIIF